MLMMRQQLFHYHYMDKSRALITTKEYFLKWAPAGLLILFVFLIYSNVYDMKFVYDDEFYILKNQFLSSFAYLDEIFTTSSTAGSGFQDSFYRPIQFFFYLLVEQVFGKEEWAFHFLNVLLHAGNTILLFILGCKILRNQTTAFSVSLLWAAHPVHTEVIAYISGTADPLQFFFSLLSLNLFLLNNRKAFFLSHLTYLLAIMSKEVAIVLPGLIGAVIFMTEKERWSFKKYWPTLSYFALGLCYVALRKFFFYGDGSFDFYKTQNIYTENIHYRVFTFLATLPAYFKLLIWPVDLHIDRSFSVYTKITFLPVMIGAVVVFFAILFLIFSRKKKSLFYVVGGGAILWFAAGHALHSGVVIPLNSLFLEHWLYLPSVGGFLWLGAVIQSVESKKLKRALLGLVYLICLLLGYLTYQQNRMWENAETLFSTILKHNPQVTRVRHNLAMAYSDQNKDDLALEEYKKILSLDEPPYPQTHHNLALLYFRRGEYSLGEEHLLRAVQINENFFPSYPYLIDYYENSGQKEKATEWREKLGRLKSRGAF